MGMTPKQVIAWRKSKAGLAEKARLDNLKSKSTENKPAETNSLYIGETNWEKLQKKYHPDQLEYATKLVDGKRYWDETKHIEDFKFNKSQELDIARQRISKGTGTPTDTANIAHKSELDKIAEEINAGQQEDFNEKERENGDAITTRYDDLKTGADEMKDILTGGDERPEAPSMVDLYEEFQSGERGEMYKTTELEESLSAFKDEAREAEARMRERMEYERDKPVAMGVISGKTSEIQKQEQRNIDFANRQIAYITDQLNTRYNMIETMMNLTQTDYTNAVNAYDKEFAQNMQAINLVRGIEKDEKSEQDRQADNARANMQIIINSLVKGNMDFADLSDDQKLEMRKLEVQAGLPSGFMENLKLSIDEKSKLISTTARTDPNGNKYIDVLVRDENGDLKINSIYSGKVKVSSGGSGGGWPTGTPTSYKEWKLAGGEKTGKSYDEWLEKEGNISSADQLKMDATEMSNKLKSVSGSDGYISPADYTTAKKAWVSAGYKSKDFDERFSTFRNPDNDEYFIDY